MDTLGKPSLLNAVPGLKDLSFMGKKAVRHFSYSYVAAYIRIAAWVAPNV